MQLSPEDEQFRDRLRRWLAESLTGPFAALRGAGGPGREHEAHEDRLARFGFDYLEHVATRNGCEIIVANQESLSPQQELVEDLLAIVHTFSCRLYGLRRYEKTLKDELRGRLP